MSGGATTPRQFSTTTSKPASRIVGASSPPTWTGSAVETASTRILPALTWSSNSDAPETPACTEPERIAWFASPPPE